LPRPGELLTNFDFWKDNITPEIEKCLELEDDDFSVMYTRYKFEELQMPGKKLYDKCYGGQFVPVVDANGDIVNCMYFLKNPDYVLGNLNEKNFKRIWNGGWWRRIEKLDLSKCQVCCKNNEINKFLYVAKHKPFIHENFI
jgi:sulfatase maturation enzyme AslB (radical SAM superfamily)